MSPRVPLFNEGIAADVPGVNHDRHVQGIGAAGDAFEQLGSQLAQSGEQLFGTINRQEADANSFARSQATDQYLTAEGLKMKQRSPDGYAYNEDGTPITDSAGNKRTLTDVFKETANERFRQDQDSAQTGLEQREYRQRAQPFITSHIEAMQADEFRKRTQFSTNLTEATRRSIQSGIALDPRTEKIYQGMMTLESSYADQVRNHGMDAATANTLSQQDLQQAAYSGMESKYKLATQASTYEEQGRLARLGQLILQGKDPVSKRERDLNHPTIAQRMTQDQISDLNDKFDTLINGEKTGTASEVKAMAKEMEAGWTLETENPALNSAAAAKADSMLPGFLSKAMKLDKSDLETNQMVSSVRAHQKAALMRSADRMGLPLDQQAKLADSDFAQLMKTDPSLTAQKTYYDLKTRFLKSNDTLARKDWASYAGLVKPVVAAGNSVAFGAQGEIAKNAPAIQQAVQASAALQGRVMPGDDTVFKPIPIKNAPGGVEELAGLLKNEATSPEAAAQTIKDMVGAYQDYFNDAKKQLVDDGHLPHGWMQLRPGMTTTAMETLIRGLKSKDFSSPEFQDSLANFGPGKAGFIRQVDTAIAPYVEGLANVTPGDPQANEKATDMYNLARQLTAAELRGKIPTTEAINIAVGHVMEQLVKSQLRYTTLSASSGTYHLAIPNEVDPNAESKLALLQEKFNSPDGWKAAGIAVPKGLTADGFYRDASKNVHVGWSDNYKKLNIYWAGKDGRWQQAFVQVPGSSDPVPYGIRLSDPELKGVGK